MNTIGIIQQSLEYYDKNNDKHQKIKKQIKYIQNDKTNNNVIFYDKNKNKLFSSEIEIVGKFYKKNNVWVWGWGIPNLKSHSTKTIKKILDYGIAIEPTNISKLILKNELITSRFMIDDLYQLDIHNALASYLSKTEFIYCLTNDFFMDKNNEMIKTNESTIKNSDIVYFVFIKNYKS
jgi:hypothetical protein